MARLPSKPGKKPASPKAEKKIRKQKEKEGKQSNKTSVKSKVDPKRTPEKKSVNKKGPKKNKHDGENDNEKPEEIEVTIEYLSGKKEKHDQKDESPIIVHSGKKSGRKPKNQGTSSAIEKAKGKDKSKTPYQGKDSISSVLEHKKAASFKDLLNLLKSSYEIDSNSDSAVKLDLAALEKSGIVVSTSSGYELYKDFVFEAAPASKKESIKKKPPTETKEVKESVKEGKTSKKKTIEKTSTGKKGRKPSNKKSAIKEKSEEDVKETENKVATLEIMEEDDNDDEFDMLKEEEIIRPSSTKKSEKKPLINLEQEDD